MTRAEFLRLAALTAVAPWPTRLSARGQEGPPRPSLPGVSSDAIARVIEAYDRQGLHRTGTEVDRMSGEWLRAEAERRGAAASLEPFTLQRFDVVAAYIESGGRRVDGLPLFDGGTTGPDGVAGRLGEDADGAPLVVTRLDGSAIRSEGRGLEGLRRSERARAIVGITAGPHPGLSPSNAAQFADPYGAPVLQMGSEHEPWLSEQAARGAESRVVIHTVRTPATATNVVATVNGSDPQRAPLYVITPRSGWWHCASERGGGIACWLEAIAAVCAASPVRPVVFIASSGHELGHLGLDAAIHARPGIVRGAAAWIHLGANIGAAGGRARLQASDQPTAALALSALERAAAPEVDRVPQGTVPAGEARNIHVGGGRYLSLLGSGPYFHNIADRWPQAVDAQAVTRYARAMAACAIALSSRADLPAKGA